MNDSRSFSELLAEYEQSQIDDNLAFEVVRKYPGLAFVKERFEDPIKFIMLEVSDVYERQVCGGDKSIYLGKTDFEAGTPSKKLWTYEEAEGFYRSDVQITSPMGMGGVVNEPWTSSVTEQKDSWNGKKMCTRRDGRVLLWGFD